MKGYRNTMRLKPQVLGGLRACLIYSSWCLEEDLIKRSSFRYSDKRVPSIVTPSEQTGTCYGINVYIRKQFKLYRDRNVENDHSVNIFSELKTRC